MTFRTDFDRLHVDVSRTFTLRAGSSLRRQRMVSHRRRIAAMLWRVVIQWATRPSEADGGKAVLGHIRGWVAVMKTDRDFCRAMKPWRAPLDPAVAPTTPEIVVVTHRTGMILVPHRSPPPLVIPRLKPPQTIHMTATGRYVLSEHFRRQVPPLRINGRGAVMTEVAEARLPPDVRPSTARNVRVNWHTGK